jgi:phytoene desaturase (3,4-didehydrolycopene-forming)
MLAKAGMKVQLLEKNPEVGGRCQSVDSQKVKGYRWDTGPSLLLLPQKYDDAFKRLGTDLKKELNLKKVEPAYRVVFGDETYIDVEYDVLKMTKQMEEFEPGCSSNYYNFLSVSRRMLDFGVERFVDRQFETWQDLVALPELLPKMLLRGWITIPLLNMLGPIDWLMQLFFKDERLRAIFTFQTLYVGLTPYSSPGALCLLAGTDLSDGVWYPEGGWRGVRDSLTRLADESGVQTQTNVEVDEVIVEGGKAVGVKMQNGEEKRADVVIVNQDLPLAYRTLLRNADASGAKGASDFAQDWNKKDYSCGIIAFYWALDREVPFLRQHSIYLGAPTNTAKAWKPITSVSDICDKPNFYVHCPRQTDPTAAPAGGESMMVLFPIGNLQDMAKVGKKPTGTKGELYADLKAAAKEAILRRFEESGAGEIRQHIVEEFVRDPEDLLDLYGLEHGATFSLSHDLFQLAMTRPPPRSAEVDDLFFVGAGTRPGNGVPLVLMGAGILSEQILADFEEKAKPSAGSPGRQASA